jgi:hypothetical protein
MTAWHKFAKETFKMDTVDGARSKLQGFILFC